MKPIFYRGDYKAFLVIAERDSLDVPLYAFPIFEDEKVSDVLHRYVSLYVPSDAKIKYVDLDIDCVTSLGYVLMHVKCNNTKFVISTITPNNNLWNVVIPLWEDQWVFDYMNSTQMIIPLSSSRDLTGCSWTMHRVREIAEATYSRYMLMTLVVYTVFIFMNSRKDDS